MKIADLDYSEIQLVAQLWSCFVMEITNVFKVVSL